MGSFTIAATISVFSVLYLSSPDVAVIQVAAFAILVLPCLSLPFLLRRGVSVGFLSGLLVILIQVVLAGSALLDRGVDDVAMLWLVATPLFAAFVGGPRTGLVTAATAALAACIPLAFAEMGYIFPNLMSAVFARRYHVANVAGAAGIVAVLAWLFEGPIARHLHRLSDDLRDANAGLRAELTMRREAQAQAEAANRAKDALFANLSHEFRTPLTAILSGAEVLQLDASDDDRQVLGSVERGAHRLLATLDGVLDLMQIESGDVGLAAEPIDVQPLLHEVVDSFQRAAEAKGISLAVSGTEVHVEGDRAALHRLFSALVDNAVRFTERGGVTVEVGTDDACVVVSVMDTGIGMSSAFLERAATPFTQASEGHARTHEGLGLGLTLAQRLAVAMNGRTEIESVPNQGTTVRVWLPEAPREVSVAPARRRAPRE